MMATVPPASSGLLPLLETLEDSGAGGAEHTDAYLTITNRLSGEDGRNFLPAVIKHFPRLGKAFQIHISSENVELSQAALQALGFCVFHSNVVSGIPEHVLEDLLVSLTSLVVNASDKNTCTRALWVISKQNFPVEVVAKKVTDILKTLDALQAREDLQSVILEHEALNVIIRLLEQTPAQMGERAVQWAKLVIPLVVHSASKVRLRAAAALEIGLPLLLEKQLEVAAIIEPLMSSKLIPELQKLFSSKYESNVLKLWPLFVRLLGKLLHRGGPFINSLLHLEELGFRSSSPIIKKIAFIAWKSLIDNFALNPEILCSTKRLKLLMQPLSSIQVRTEALLLTKVEVWWYLVVKLGPNLAANFEQVGVPLLQSALSVESPAKSPATPVGSNCPNTSIAPSTPKTGVHSLAGSASTPRMNLNSSMLAAQSFPSIQLLGLEMLLHYFLGSEVTAMAAKHKLQLSLEPLAYPLLASPSSFYKFSNFLISAVRDGFIGIGKDAPDSLVTLIWNNLISLVMAAIETGTTTAGNKKERQGSEVLAMLLQALQCIVCSEALPPQRTLALLEGTVRCIPQKILGSAAYQVANMDVLNGTPALFLILLFYHNSLIPSFSLDERFYLCLETLVGSGLTGPASPLAFSESVLGVMSNAVGAVENKEHLWRMWSIVVNPLTDTIVQTNEVNQGDALEHNFTAVYSALMFPVTHLLPGQALSQMTQKSLLGTWSRLYRAFARCAALVATAEENVCCEELCCKMAASLDQQALSNLAVLDAVANILMVIIECIDFSPYTVKFQQKSKSPCTPLSWVRKKNKALGNLTTFHALLVQCLESFVSRMSSETSVEGLVLSVGALASVLLAILSALFSSMALASAIEEMLCRLTYPLAAFYEQLVRLQDEQPSLHTSVGPKLEKLVGELLACLQTRAVLAYDSELLSRLTPLLRVLLPHKNKQIRTLVTQFWNATFANAPVLAYPDELRPVLSQVKQSAPIILPGFQTVDVSDDLSGQYSGECSQLETKISGVAVNSAGQRDSLLARAEELKRKASSKAISVKLDFGPLKPPAQGNLEEEASLDFVFIPPETKQRVMTEHQKEVRSTKRVDIPAMYNNLDASLDTTLFSQYTQSQDELKEVVPADDVANCVPVEELNNEACEEKMDTEELHPCDIEMSQDATGMNSERKSAEDGICSQEKMPDGDDISEQEKAAELFTNNCKQPSSDVMSKTPQKPSSRRQVFITLEKYDEGKAAGHVKETTFTFPLSSIPQGQDVNSSLFPDASQTEQDPVPDEEANGVNCGEQEDQPPELSDLQVVSADEAEPETAPDLVKEAEDSSQFQDTDDDEDIIPNTQEDSVVTKKSLAKRKKRSHPEDQSESPQSDSQNSPFLSDQGAIRRSSRRRSRPVRPGEDRVEVEKRYMLAKLTTPDRVTRDSNSQSSPSSSPPESHLAGRSTRRSQLAADALEPQNKEKRRSRTSKEDKEMSPSNLQTGSSLVASKSQTRITRRSRVTSEGTQLMDTDQPKTIKPMQEKRLRHRDSRKVSSSPLSQTDVQSQGRLSRRKKMTVEAVELGEKDKLKNMTASEETKMSQNDSQISSPVTQTDVQCEGRPGRRSKITADEPELGDKDKLRNTPAGEEAEMSQSDSQKISSSPVTRTDVRCKGRPGRRSKVTAEEVELDDNDKVKDMASTEDTKHSPRDSQISSSPISQTAVQCQIRSGRKTTVMSPTKEKVVSESQNICSQEEVLFHVSPKGKMARDTHASRSSLVGAKMSLLSGTDEGLRESQGLARYRTRQSSHYLLFSPENSKLECSEMPKRSQSSARRGRKRKLSTGLTPGEAQRAWEKPEGVSQVKHEVPAESKSSDFSQGTKSETTVTETSESETPDSVTETVVLESPTRHPLESDNGILETKAAARDYASSENAESEESKSEVLEGSTDLANTVSKSGQVHVCPCSKRTQFSKGCSCKMMEALSQENEGSYSQNTDSQQEDKTSHDYIKLGFHSTDAAQTQSDTAAQDVNLSTDNAVFVETSTPSGPPISSDTSRISAIETEEESDCSDAYVLKDQNITELEDTYCEVETENVTIDELIETSKGVDSMTETVVPESLIKQPLESDEADNIGNQILAMADTHEKEEHMFVQEETHGLDITDTPLQNQSAAVSLEEDKDTIINDTSMDVTAAPVGSTALPEEPSVASEALKTLCVDSPPKQKCLDGVSGLLDAGQSPSSGRTRGVWSPSASPSTSILKKGLKRPMEEESPSPVLKSRRVSFADPIHHQELADDIDRRTPVLRTSSNSSPRSKTSASSAQQKYISTPTKGFLLSPRNLRSPGSKSSKKCLMSEMTQEPKAIPEDCVYPALVGCSVPVEAVLPQITSNMWPRGFGQLVRARNIKTVGDLSALTPDEIKSLPIRSPKLCNVKKALKSYHEQQRKGRGDELKAFDEMEKMTSEPEETGVAQSQEHEEEKPSVEVTEMEAAAAPTSPPLPAERESADLLLKAEALAGLTTQEELQRCSPAQLVQLHECLGGVMRSVVMELHSRLAPRDGDGNGDCGH